MTPAHRAPRADAAAPPLATLTRGRIALFAVCCGAIVANLYYAQPIIGLIAPDVSMSGAVASFIVSLTQIGYALGMFFLVPLGDLVENKRLVLTMTGLSAVSLVLAALAPNAPAFLALSFLIGISSVAVQMLIPLAAHLAPEASRGRVVGTVMSGLLLGILLARPFASAVADHLGWRAVFVTAAVMMVAVFAMLAATMPRHRPATRSSYGGLLRSLGTLVKRHAVLRERAFYQGCMFATFTLFWTAVPLELARRHGLSQSQIAVFALVGALGAIAAPLSGRLADAGHGRIGSLAALGLASVAYLPALVYPSSGVAALVVTGVLIDFCVQMNMVLDQREIYALDASSRSRLNALYMTSIFIGGSVGAALASPLYDHGGWRSVALAGTAFAAIAALRFLFVQGRPMAARSPSAAS